MFRWIQKVSLSGRIVRLPGAEDGRKGERKRHRCGWQLSPWITFILTRCQKILSVLPWKQISVSTTSSWMEVQVTAISCLNYGSNFPAVSLLFHLPCLQSLSNLTTKMIFVKTHLETHASHCLGPSHHYFSPGLFFFIFNFFLAALLSLAGS